MNQQKAAVLPWLDLIRYVAALLVVMGHFRADLFLNYNELLSSQQSIMMQLASVSYTHLTLPTNSLV